MNALVTGATGFLGSWLCRRLAKDGYNLTILCRETSKTEALDGLKFTKIIGDVTDAESVLKAVEGNEIVFHAAANGTYWGRQKEIQNTTNIQGTKNVVEACRQKKVKKLVHVSSIAAIGIPENAEHPADENFRFNLENSPFNYHISKKRAEGIVLNAVENGLDAVIVNPSSIWGQFGKNYRLEEFAQKVKQTRIIPYFTGGICPVHVEDVVEGMLLAAAKGKIGERYILSGENLTFKEIAEMIAEKQDLQRTFVPVPKVVSWLAAASLESVALITKRRPRITFVTHYVASRFHYYNSNKARKELGFTPRDFQAILNECLSFIESRNGKN